MQWTRAPVRVRYVPGVIAAVIGSLPEQFLEEHAARRDPAMIGVGREAIAVPERPVMHDDPADATARALCEVAEVAAFEVNHRRHDAPPPDNVCDTDCVFPVTVRIRTCDGSSRGSPRSSGTYTAERPGMMTALHVTWHNGCARKGHWPSETRTATRRSTIRGRFAASPTPPKIAADAISGRGRRRPCSARVRK